MLGDLTDHQCGGRYDATGSFWLQTAQIPDFPWDKSREIWQARAEGLKCSGQNVPLEAESALCTLPLAPRALGSGWGIPQAPAFPSSEQQPTDTFFSSPNLAFPQAGHQCILLHGPQAGGPAFLSFRTCTSWLSQQGEVAHAQRGKGMCVCFRGNIEERISSFLIHPVVHSKFRKFSAV